jgi:negative regulator of flagellin synthesis FlgM
MHVYGPTGAHGPQPVPAPHAARPHTVEAPPASSTPVDELHLSDHGRLLEAARQLPEIRAQRVAEIRAALAEGTYDIESRLEAAVDRLLDEIA